jgi:hypothetical protein
MAISPETHPLAGAHIGFYALAFANSPRLVALPTTYPDGNRYWKLFGQTHFANGIPSRLHSPLSYP